MGDNMRKTKWKAYAIWIILVEAVGALAAWLTRDGVEIYNAAVVKPNLSPPPVLFPIVWAILYALMGISIARIYLNPDSAARTQSLRLFIVQLVFNFLWSIIFFNFQAFGLAFVWLVVLWALILMMILTFNKVDPPAAKLQIPYLIWVTFAGYLNLMVWLLN